MCSWEGKRKEIGRPFNRKGEIIEIWAIWVNGYQFERVRHSLWLLKHSVIAFIVLVLVLNLMRYHKSALRVRIYPLCCSLFTFSSFFKCDFDSIDESQRERFPVYLSKEKQFSLSTLSFRISVV